MRRLLRWLGAVLGVVALLRLLSRRRVTDVVAPELEPPAETPALDTRAEELRQRLREARALEEEREEFEAGETTLDRADPDEAVERRRREVHESARAAADEMRASGGPTEP